MASFPGPRTHPTVKPLATMNNKNLRSWELRLGPIQVVMIVGLVLGSMVCSYWLGTWSGQTAGFSMASDINLNAAPKQAISEDQVDEPEGGEPLADIYDKLSASGSLGTPGAPSQDTPKLGVIESSDVIPTLKPEAAATIEAPAAKIIQKIDPPSSEATPDSAVRVLGAAEGNSPIPSAAKVLDSTADSDKKTLGSLIKERENVGPVTIVAKGDKVTSDGKEVALLEKQSIEERLAAAKHQDEVASVQGRTSPALDASKPDSVVPTRSGDRVIAPSKSKENETLSAKKIEVAKATPTKKLVTTPSVKSGFVRDVLPKGWFAQIAAPKSVGEAESVARQLKAAGFSVMIERADVRGDQYFRLLVGPEVSKEQAERLIAQVKREKVIKGDPFLRLIK